jgi:hypothetical protein
MVLKLNEIYDLFKKERNGFNLKWTSNSKS